MSHSNTRDPSDRKQAMDLDYMTAEQLTELVPGTTKSYWANLRYLGNGPGYYKPTGKIVLYKRQEVLAWLDASHTTGTAEHSGR